MKKISIFILAALAMVSCGNSYKAQEVTLNNEADSINYAVGLLNGLQVKMYYMANDSSDEAVAEFVDALENAYMDKDEKLSDIAQAGRQLGASVKGFEKNGLADNAAWTLNEKLYFQGMVNALHGDTTMIPLTSPRTVEGSGPGDETNARMRPVAGSSARTQPLRSLSSCQARRCKASRMVRRAANRAARRVSVTGRRSWRQRN